MISFNRSFILFIGKRSNDGIRDWTNFNEEYSYRGEKCRTSKSKQNAWAGSERPNWAIPIGLWSISDWQSKKRSNSLSNAESLPGILFLPIFWTFWYQIHADQAKLWAEKASKVVSFCQAGFLLRELKFTGKIKLSFYQSFHLPGSTVLR